MKQREITGVAKQKYQSLIDDLAKRGYKVKLVDAELKDYAGMNPLAAKDIGFPIPANEIWIDKKLPLLRQYFTLRHESEEMNLMQGGMSYWEAHKKALKIEEQLADVLEPNIKKNVPHVVKVHDDGDMTIKHENRIYITTPQGEAFKKVRTGDPEMRMLRQARMGVEHHRNVIPKHPKQHHRKRFIRGVLRHKGR